MNKKLDRQLLIDVILAKKGKITAVAQALSVSRFAIYEAAKRWSTVQQAIDEARNDFDDTLLDLAEVKLMTAVQKGEVWAIRYSLDKKGQKRGYVDRKEVTGADGGALVTLSWGDS